ncbi:MAG: hypothetical protein O7F17_11010 [Planctomycetota bacterium]|nr:hypothetical protein [Planctomycetota bacterium]MCZ6852159.1 hypothetical protein [Planctomycetota bacterium]
MTPQITAAITVALATAVSVLSVVLGVLIGPRLAERSRLRDRLRIAYADFISAVQALKRGKVMLEVDRAVMRQASTEEDRQFFAVRFDASNRRVLDSSGDITAARMMVDFVEVDREFRQRIKDIFEEVCLIATVHDKKQLGGITIRVDEKCDSLIVAIRTKHPLLKLGRTA